MSATTTFSRHDDLLGPVDLDWRQVYDYVLSRTDLGPLVGVLVGAGLLRRRRDSEDRDDRPT